MIIGLLVLSCMLLAMFGLLFRVSYAIRRKQRATMAELDHAEWLETMEGALVIVGIGLAIIAWLLFLEHRMV